MASNLHKIVPLSRTGIQTLCFLSSATLRNLRLGLRITKSLTTMLKNLRNGRHKEPYNDQPRADTLDAYKHDAKCP